jgi:transcriptional regulator with XRE-family HTH domain
MPKSLSTLLTDENLREAGISQNDLSLISGLSHTYLTSLRSGKIQRPGRDKIIPVSIALNLSFEETNHLLAEHGMLPLQEADIKLFVAVSKKRMIRGHQPLFDNINFDLLLISLESLDGELVVVSNKPTAVLRDPAQITFMDKRDGITDPTYLRFREELARERRGILDERLEKFKMSYLLCHHCLEEYLSEAKKDEEEYAYVQRHVETLVEYLRHPNFRLSLTTQCPALLFEIKTLPGSAESEKHYKVFYIGHINRKHGTPEADGSHCRPYERLYGFATDSLKIATHFKNEYDSLMEKCLLKGTSGDDAARYIKGLL